VPHGGARSDLLRLTRGPETGNHDEACLACHPNAGWNADSAIAALHPQKIAEGDSAVDLALVPTDAQGNKRMGCRTCHDPHGGAVPVHLARVGDGEPTEALCLSCHEEQRLIRLTRHAPEVLAADGYDTDSCKPCHAMHAAPNATWGQVLSPRFLMAYCEVDPELQGDCVPCLACHHEGTAAPVRAVDRHPEVVAMNLFEPDDPGYMPLFANDGKVDVQGEVTCRTCHVSHGRLDLLRRVEANEELTPEERQSIRTQVRPFRPPNVCTSCHGAEARMKYLFFHDPQRRGVPVSQ
jgi:predicted CXXCH cytochrome family protein